MPMGNAITIARVGGACLAGFALVCLSASFAEAVYGPRTKIGNNYQQWSSTTSENVIDPADCDSVNCSVLFQQTPQQRPLIVQQVTCRAGTLSAADLELEVVELRTRKGGDINVDRSSHLVPVPTADGWWAINSPVMHLLKSSERAYVRFFNRTATNWFGLECSISGKLQQP